MRNRKQLTEPTDPWDTPDPPLALAEQQMRWYARHRNRSRVAYQISEASILLAAAGTMVTAALQASPLTITSLAAISLILTGSRKIFDWREDWVAYGNAWAELRAAINDYRLLPGDRRGQQARRHLIDKLNEVTSGDTERLASRRHSMAEIRE
jgi:hypothetical protein